MTQTQTTDLLSERRRLALLAADGDQAAVQALLKIEARIQVDRLTTERAELAEQQRGIDAAELERLAAADAHAALVEQRRELMTAAIQVADKAQKQLEALCATCRNLLAATADVHGLNQRLGYGNPTMPSISLAAYVESRLGDAGVGRGYLTWQEEGQRLADRLNLEVD